MSGPSAHASPANGLHTPGLNAAAFVPDVSKQIAASLPGMAHFALTGPAGTHCFGCAFWGAGRTFKRYAPTFTDKEAQRSGRLRPRGCTKFPQMMQADNSPALPAETPSCRHFEVRENAPPMHAPRPVKAKA